MENVYLYHALLLKEARGGSMTRPARMRASFLLLLLQVRNEPAERPDEISGGGWQDRSPSYRRSGVGRSA
jgi:hypothetical protein